MLVFQAAQFTLMLMLTLAIFAPNNDDIKFGKKFSEKYPWAEVFLNATKRPVLMVTLLLVSSANHAVVIAGMLSNMIVMITGLILRNAKIIEKCNCLGFQGVSGGRVEKNLSILLWITTTFCLINILRAMGDTVVVSNLVALNPFLCAGSVALSLVIFCIIKYKKTRRKLLTERSGSQARRKLSSDDIIGKSPSGKDLCLGSISKHHRPLLMIGVADGCQSCSEAEPRLRKLAQAFEREMTVIFIRYRNQSTVEDEVKNEEIFVADSFMEKLGVDSFPFALLIDPSTYSRLSPPIYGTNGIWGLFNLGLGLLKPRH